jgi:hypothetical protein
MSERLECEAIARKALGEPKRDGGELCFRCPRPERHKNGDAHPSLKINPKKNVFMCGPCGARGTAWQLAALLAGVDPADKPAVKTWLCEHGLLNLTGAKRPNLKNCRGPVVAEFIHEDASGNPVCKKRRHEPGANGREKDYTWQRFEGGKWINGLGRPALTPPLYRLPQIKDEPLVFFFESHTDVDRAESMRLAATTSGGVGSWRQEYAEGFAGKSVCLVPDNDAPGAGYQATVCASLYGRVLSLKVVSIAPHPDFLRWADAGGTVELLLELHTEAPEWKPAPLEASGQGHATPEAPACSGGDAGRVSAATKLVRLAEHMDLFHDVMGDAYATVMVDGHGETMRVDSRAFRRRLSFEFYVTEGKAPSAQATAAALPTIEAKALFDGNQREVHVRVAEHDGAIYVDLCSPEWDAVRITRTGWTIVHDPLVRFVRRREMLPLPPPEQGGPIDLLRRFVNVEKADWPLLTGYLLGCLHEAGPFPILALVGEQGTGKSTLSRLLKTVVDPSAIPVRCAPKDERDLLIAAQGARVLALDNLSHLDEQLSDALCRLATGTGLGTRTLYTDRDETIFRAAKPVIINSITDVITRSDLLDRSIVVSVPPLEPKNRRPEAEYWADFTKVHSWILGCFCDAASMALCETKGSDCIPDVRMLDVALFVAKGETALGLRDGSFLRAYESNRKSANDSIIELSPVAQAVMSLLAESGYWQGSFVELLTLLTSSVSKEIARSREWPKTARGLSGAIRRLVPNLRRLMIKVAFVGREPHSGRSLVSIGEIGVESSPPSPNRGDPHQTFTGQSIDGTTDNATVTGRVNMVNVITDPSIAVNVATARPGIEKNGNPPVVMFEEWQI